MGEPSMNVREACIQDAERIAIVHVDSWKTTYKGIISESYLSNLSVEKRMNNWLWTFGNLNVHEKIFVAVDNEGSIIGFANGGRSRNDEHRHGGELYAIYLLEGYQKLGIGKLLFNTVVNSLKESGYSSMMLWVLKDNPSLGFYKSMGGQTIGEKAITIGGDSLIELAIGWDSI